MKRYRFFYHYNKQKNKMSIHFRKQCIVVDNLVCNVPCETHWNSTQPKLVVRGFAKEVFVDSNNRAYIN